MTSELCCPRTALSTNCAVHASLCKMILVRRYSSESQSAAEERRHVQMLQYAEIGSDFLELKWQRSLTRRPLVGWAKAANCWSINASFPSLCHSSVSLSMLRVRFANPHCGARASSHLGWIWYFFQHAFALCQKKQVVWVRGELTLQSFRDQYSCFLLIIFSLLPCDGCEIG